MLIPPTLYKGMGQRGKEFHAWIALCLAFGVKNYVELGWGSGETAQFAKDAGLKVVSVDFVTPPVGGEREGIHYIHSESWDWKAVERTVKHFGCMPDAVFIDAEHENGCPQRDFSTWWPVANTLVGFHDIEAFDSGRLWSEIRLKYRSLEITSQDWQSQVDWVNYGGKFAGIGVLFKERNS